MSDEENSSSSELPVQNKLKKMLKMALPHVGLAVFLFLYLLLGAYAFYYQEYDADKKIQMTKLHLIRQRYRKIENETTTGYAYATPVTPIGQSFAIIYGLVGIPLMVLAAVDFGRFLSHIVLEIYSKYLDLVHKLKIMKTVIMERHRARDEKRRLHAFKRLVQDTGSTISECTTQKDVPLEEEQTTDSDEMPEKRLPLVINASILLIFCMLGGVLYIAAGGRATFIESFFLTFNLVANLTMSEMPTELNHILTIIYIFVFVTCVLSMSAELAALELKELFMKIHYFGRRINFKRRQPKKEQMDVQVKELLKIIEEIRKRYPEKEKITTMDILEYMHENTVNDKLNERRDTIAFMPQTMEVIKFADEQDLEERSFSRHEDVASLGGKASTKLASVVDVMSFSPEENMEKRFKKEIRKYTTEIKYVNKRGQITNKAEL
ncbi:Protein CBR-TWK-47 [Caenorhabditis briggsae]|uniref:Protein CBR-TWK-47 n=1 Tax=Caenorhabditis briggsae TaxID=6238 RepID=A8WW40_CAEBR|nr:Protein CBR-TWK-47 [Caenorhabditis briggsae]CAP24849.1 Protein CBR-TWK-47 [Caenorhabditis briggsae]